MSGSKFPRTCLDICLALGLVVAMGLVGGIPSAATAAAAAAPKNTSLPTISGSAKQGQKLTASKGKWKYVPTSFSYQWRRCNSGGSGCNNIAGATASSYTLAVADIGRTIRVVVTAKNSKGSTPATSKQTALVAGLPPANTSLPALSGTANLGDKLTSTNGVWSNTPKVWSYQWRRCDAAGANCANITSANLTTYTLAAADVGKTVRMVVTASNNYGSTTATMGWIAMRARPSAS